MASYLSAQEVKNEFGIPFHTLLLWRKNCLILDRPIRTKREGRNVYYSRADLERVKKLTMSEADRFIDKKGVWIPFGVIRPIYGFDSTTVGTWRTFCHRLGRPIRFQRVRRLIGNAYKTVWVYLQTDLEAIVASDDPANAGNWLTPKQVKPLFGWEAELLIRWAKNCPVLGRAILTKLRGKRTRLYSRLDLERVKKLTMSEPDRYEDEAGVWLPPDAVFARFGFLSGTLSGWAKSCPLLQRPIKRVKVVRRITNANSFHTKPVWVYLLEDLKTINAALGKPLAVGEEWVTDTEAAAEFGAAEATIEVWAKDGCPWLNGRKLRRRPVVLGGSLKKSRPRFYYYRPDLEEAAKNRDAEPPSNGVFITTGEANKRTGEDRNTLRGWIKSCPYIGKPVRHRIEKTRLADGRNQKVVLLHWGDVERAVAAKTEGANLDEDVLTTKEVADLCEVHPATVRKWERHGCTHLEGRKLASEERVRTEGKGTPKYQVFRRADVKELLEAMGKTPPESWYENQEPKTPTNNAPENSSRPIPPRTKEAEPKPSPKRRGRPDTRERDELIEQFATANGLDGQHAVIARRLNGDEEFVKAHGTLTRQAVRLASKRMKKRALKSK